MVISDGDAAGIPVAQRTVDAGHEQAAALDILQDQAVQLEGFIVSADALHAQHKTLLAIANRGAESLIGLKDNQKTAFAYAKAQLAAAPPLFAVVASAAGAGLKCAP